MIEFETFVYLDLQKTATTSIATFLRHYVDEREQVHAGHSAPKPGHDRGKFHFVSVREPIALYRSYFLYSCGKRGGIYDRFKRIDEEHLFEPTNENFHAWLDFMLSPKKTRRLGPVFAAMGVENLVGPLTQLLMRVTLVDPVTLVKAQGFADRSAVRAFYDRERLFNHYIRMEHLTDDLFAIVTADRFTARMDPPLEGLDDLKSRMPVRNRSKAAVTVTADAIPAELITRIRDQEWLMYDLFGYAEASDGKPSPLPEPA